MIVKGDVKFGSEVMFFMGASYRLDFDKLDYFGFFDGLGFNNSGSAGFSVGSSKFVAKSIDPNFVKKREEENIRVREN